MAKIHKDESCHADDSHESSKRSHETESADDSVTMSGRSLLIGLLVVAVVALLVWRFQSPPAASESVDVSVGKEVEVQDDVLARVNGEDVLRSRITSQMNQLPIQLRGQVSFFEVLNATINEVILLQESRRLGVEVSSAEANAYVAMTLNNSGITREELQRRARDRGIDEAEIVEIFRRRLTINELLQRQVFPTINVSETDAKEWYNKNKVELSIPEMVEAKHILLAQPEEANATLDRIRRGSGFEDLARELSLDKASAVDGGYLGNFTKGMMVPDFEKAAWDAKPGSLVGPIKTKFGYHLIKIVGHYKGRDRLFGEVKDLIEKKLRSERSEGAANEYVNALRQKASIDILAKPDETGPASAESPSAEESASSSVQ